MIGGIAKRLGRAALAAEPPWLSVSTTNAMNGSFNLMVSSSWRAPGRVGSGRKQTVASDRF